MNLDTGILSVYQNSKNYNLTVDEKLAFLKKKFRIAQDSVSSSSSISEKFVPSTDYSVKHPNEQAIASHVVLTPVHTPSNELLYNHPMSVLSVNSSVEFPSFSFIENMNCETETSFDKTLIMDDPLASSSETLESSISSFFESDLQLNMRALRSEVKEVYLQRSSFKQNSELLESHVNHLQATLKHSQTLLKESQDCLTVLREEKIELQKVWSISIFLITSNLNVHRICL